MAVLRPHTVIVIKEALLEDVYRIRHEVLWPGKPLDFVKVEDDENGWHFGVYENDMLVSVISLFPDSDGKSVRFRKFATLDHFQNRGFGKKLLVFGMEYSKTSGLERIWCDARADALLFYERLGFVKFSEVFLKEGLEYYKIERQIR